MKRVRSDLGIASIRSQLVFLAALLATLYSSVTSAQQNFSAKSLGDYGNITVMEVTGNYDSQSLSNSPESLFPRQVIAKEFFKTHKDEYDFLLIFTNFDFQMPAKAARAFYTPVMNDVQGIGIPLMNRSLDYGSSGKLQGTVDMGNLAKLETDPREPKFQETLSILNHEMMHRWAAYVKFLNGSSGVGSALLGRDNMHWSFLLDSGGSLMYGNRWQDNGNGTFTSITPQFETRTYSPLDLYLMGMIDKSKVPPMLLIDSPDTDPAQIPEAGITVSGSARYITVDQIIAAMGPRVPDAAMSQKNVKAAFIYITPPGTFLEQDLTGIENVRNAAITRFSVLTDGAGIMQIASSPTETVPTNPGVLMPPVAPRTLPPNINDGVAWLMTNQNADGHWADLNMTAERDTAEASRLLGSFSAAQTNYQNGLKWLGGTSSGNMDFLSRKIAALAGSGQDTSALVSEALARRNTDGGWGIDTNYASNTADTAFALQALSIAGSSNQRAIANAIAYLKTHQNPEGSWGSDDRGGLVQETANVLSVFNKYRQAYLLDDPILRGTTWLVARQNVDGGFGNSPSTVYDTATAALTLVELNAPADIVASAITYLEGRQSDNGSWNQSSYQTALAVRAVFKATVDPELSIQPEDISFIPATVTSLPGNVVISANIRNRGRTAVPQAKVALYEGDPWSGSKVAEQILSFAGQVSTVAAFSVPVTKNAGQFYTIVIDPDNLVKESNKLNNKAAKALPFAATYDLQVTPSDISLSANPADLFQDLKITAKITNNGTMDAYNVQIKYYIDDPAAAFDIATKTVDVPAGGTAVNEVFWRVNRAGVNLPLTVMADPFNNFTELSKTNNKASIPVTVNADARPNLTTSYKDLSIDPAPADRNGSVTITALVKNEGFTGASNVAVDVYAGVPGEDGVRIGSQTIPTLASGESASISIVWQQIPGPGQRIISIRVDPSGRIPEITKADNDAFTTLLIRDLPDLVLSTNSIAFSPAAPKDGDPVTIVATVQNKGEQSASNVAVQFSENGTILGTKYIPSCASSGTASVSLNYDTAGKKGQHTIAVTIDPDDRIPEQRKDNNAASRTFGVQDSNLWVTEQYISPNNDGIKDSTQLLFRLDTPQSVTVNVVNARSETVRSFKGPEPVNLDAGTVAWEGLNDDGMAVADGIYQLQVRDAHHAVLSSLPVTVDTNRSALSDAVGTKYLVNTDLTCPLPSVHDLAWKWFPDESGLLLMLPYGPNTPEYSDGLYTMAPDGQDIVRIVPSAWRAGVDPSYNYYYDSYDVSPDSEHVAFILNKLNRHTGITELRQLWVTDRFGRALLLLASFDAPSQTSVLDFIWSPDGEYLAYRTQRAGSPENLWIIKSDGTGKPILIDSGIFYGINYTRWSPGGEQLAYVAGDFNTYQRRIKIAGLTGSPRIVFAIDDHSWHEADSIAWLASRKMIFKEHFYGPGEIHNNTIWLVDLDGNDAPLNVSSPMTRTDFFVAPDKRSFAFVESDYKRGPERATLKTKTCNLEGTIITLHEFSSAGANCAPKQSSIVWMSDGKKIAFSDSVESYFLTQAPCANPVDPAPVIISVETGAETRYMADAVPFVWLADGVTLAGIGNDGLCSLNAGTGEIKCMPVPSESRMPADAGNYLSPRQRYLMQYRYIDAASACSQEGTKSLDLWSVSSLLNLTAELRVVQSASAIILKGIAFDLNFEGYQLEYADAKNPTNWSPVSPPSDVPVLNDTFTTWVPPYEGSFFVRLKVWDKAGNAAESRKRVSWGLSSSITNFIKTPDVISPNKDSDQAAMELHYRVLEPVHLEFNIYNDADALVKTIHKDYASPAEDLIVWDGTDEAGNVVPDGKYGLKVFDYEFFVEVDNTPPDARIVFSLVSFDQQNTPTVSLLGHAFDKNIKSWSVELGQGDNPRVWTPFLRGSESLAALDAQNTVVNPPQDVTLQSFIGDLEYLRGKKARITARDLGGNVVTSVSGFIEDRLYLSSESLYTQGSHTLKRIVTTPYHIAGLVLQEKIGLQWIDAAALPDADASFATFALKNIHYMSDPSGLRLKGVDIYGREYHSNALSTEQTFSLSTACGSGRIKVALLEDLTSLKLQIKGALSRQWADFKLFSGSELASLLQNDGSVTLPATASLIRIVALGESGRIYASNVAVSSCSTGSTGPYEIARMTKSGDTSRMFDPKLQISYGQGDCGNSLSGVATLTAYADIPNLALRSIRYYLDSTQGPVLLKSIDLTTERSANASVDITALPAGRYPVRAVWEYFDSSYQMLQEVSASQDIIIDHTPPLAQLTYPAGNALKLCPVKTHTSRGDTYTISVEAVVSDAAGVARYELHYGEGGNPDQWYPAVDPLSRPIAGNGGVKGPLGSWDIRTLPAGAYTLRLKAVDVAGNMSCSTATLSYDAPVEIARLAADRKLISSGNTPTIRTAAVSYEIDRYATVDARVYRLVQTGTGYSLDAEPVRDLVLGHHHFGGTGGVEWNGTDNSGAAVPDGLYGIAVHAVDGCSSELQKWVAVEVDGTPPFVDITYPKPGNVPGSIIEVKGSASDKHFQKYYLRAAAGDKPGDDPGLWTDISTDIRPVNDGILGTWNTFGIIETWTVQLTAIDMVGNTSTTTALIDLGTRRDLVRSLGLAPALFSPNMDGRLDTTTITYELTDTCDVKIEIVDAHGTARRTFIAAAMPAGAQKQPWDGTDDIGVTLNDGLYTVRLTGVQSGRQDVNQVESVTATIDAAPPLVGISQPLNNAYVRDNITVIGSIADANLSDYAMTLTGPAGTVLVDQGTQPRVNYAFGTFNDLPDGAYTLDVATRDLGENVTAKSIAFIVDKTAPIVTIDAFKNGGYYGGSNLVVNILGNIVEQNPGSFTLRYGAGESPTQWTELMSNTAVPADKQLFSWNVGLEYGVPDGTYIVSLLATDKAGSSAEARAKITVDNMPPAVSIMSPADGSIIAAATDITGTAFDLNLDTYVIDMSTGPCGTAYQWARIKTSSSSVQNGLLADWQALPLDGAYCLRVTAVDKSGNTTAAAVNVRVATHPPAPPVLSGMIINKTKANLTWTSSSATGPAGYNVYRNGQRINDAIISDALYLDQNLPEGIHAYTVTSLDGVGLESKPSNEIIVKIDLTGATARISVPQNGSRVSGLIDIKGTAYSADDFKQYRVSIGQGAAPSSWTLIRMSPLSTSYGVLAQWDTTGIVEGQPYAVKLEAEDLSGNITAHIVSVSIDNTPPVKPVLLSAVPNSADVTITWAANTESDLAGYLLYRNDQIATVSGIVIGDMKPYLLQGTMYVEKALPDGTFRYYLIAMDRAGNMSSQSNTVEVTIDTRSPHAAIVEPADEATIGHKALIRATSPDLDIAAVQFQYQGAQDAAWTNLGGPVTSATMAIYFDPAALGLNYGDYRLRAVATDKGHMTDQSPGSITITYTDLTSPAPPQGVAALVSGATVSLSWSANTETDLAGYTIYRTSGSDRVKINAAFIPLSPQPSFQDSGLADGTYWYEATATDTHNNESKPSGRARAKIYAPLITQPYSPAGQSEIQVLGSGATANATVSLSTTDSSGRVTLGTALVDSAGSFLCGAVLGPGENRLSLRAVDMAGNMSKDSSVVVVAYDVAPGTPTGAAAVIDGPHVKLTWDPNPEPFVLGYNVFRDGVKLNSADLLHASQVFITASSSHDPHGSGPEMAMDASLSSYWMPQSGTGIDHPAWWKMELTAPELISHVELRWGSDHDAAGDQVLYAAKDYEVQVWSGYAWITQANVVQNAVQDNAFDLKPSYRTDKIRIFITDSTDSKSEKQIRLAEISVLKDNVISSATMSVQSYNDLNLLNSTYGYTITAVDNYGFESLPTSTVSAVINVAPPSAPVLNVSVENSDAILNWTARPGPGATGYNVYRNAGKGWNRLGSMPATATAYLDAALLNGSYTYRVTAMDSVGNESAPSNEATAAIAVITPASPALNVRSAPDSALNASWEYRGSPAAGYNVYRSLTPGGPYTRINSMTIRGNAYLDTAVTSGIMYFYVVRAVDTVGNEGIKSNEASGIPETSALPDKPMIFLPTIAGRPVTLLESTTIIAGKAGAGTTVELFDNNAYIGSAAARSNDSITSYHVAYDGQSAALSPDGRTLAYTDNGVVKLLSFETGSSTQAFQARECDTLSWSPDSRKLAYTYYDADYFSHIGIYTIPNGVSAALTAEIDADDYVPSWLPDGNKVAFVRAAGASPGIWLKDLASGELSQIIRSVAAWDPKISPDGKTLAYTDGAGLYLYELNNNTNAVIDENAYEPAWSPDGNSLAFVSYKNDYDDVFVLDLATGNRALLTDSSGHPSSLSWTADGQYVLFESERWDDTQWIATPWMAGFRSRTKPERILPDLQNVSSVESSKAGTVAAISQNNDGSIAAYLLIPKGMFSVAGVPLTPGENLFAATSTNEAGKASAPSEPIMVTFNANAFPDLTVTAADVYIYPPYPIVGEQMSINAVVANSGHRDASNVEVSVYLWNARGQRELLKSQTIPSMAAGSSALITAAWDSSGKAGNNRLVVVIDPTNTVEESDETNNMAIRDFYTADHVGLSMDMSTDYAQYDSNQNVNVSVAIWNTGQVTSAVLNVRIEDLNGYPLSSYETRTVGLAYAAESDQYFSWNTGSSYAGPYNAHAVLKDASGAVIADNTAPFSIIPDPALDLTIATDRVSYESGETVNTGITIMNKAKNYIIPAMMAAVSISNSAGKILFQEVKTAANVLPGASIDLISPWNTGLNAPGDYHASVAVTIDKGVTITKTTAFTVMASRVLTGAITVSPQVVPIGTTMQATYTIANTGSADLIGQTVRCSVVDPETLTVLQVSDEVLDIAKNSSRSGRVAVNTTGYSLKAYSVILQSVSNGALKNLAASSFNIRDLTPPAVTILSPVSGSTHGAAIPVSVRVVDNASGVDQVEYQIDSGPWKMLSPADSRQGQYATMWEPTRTDNGSHMIAFRATDIAGNQSGPVSVDLMVRIKTDTTPPSGSILINDGAAYTNNANVNLTLACTDAESGCSLMQFSDDTTAWTAQDPFGTTRTWLLSNNDGQKKIFVLYTDAAGNTSIASSATITLDTTPPVLTLSTLQNGAYTNNPTLNIAGTAGDANGIRSLVISGQTVTPATPDNVIYFFSRPVTLATGTNTITTVVTDMASNTTSDVRTITLDQTAPVITITGPADNSVTRSPAVVVDGTTDKSCTVLISVNSGPTVTAASDATSFSLPVSLLTNTLNTINVRAADLAGNPAMAKRTVTNDNTKPSLAITVPNQDMGTNQTNISLSGTVSDLTEVTLLASCPTASVNVVSRTSSTTWSVDIENLQQGNNAVTVTATDQAGNTTSVIRNIISSQTAVTIDPVKTPVNNKQQTLTGTRELASSVTVSYAAAIVREVLYPTPTTWSADVTDMTEGANIMSAAATDLEGRSSNAVTALIMLDTQPPASTITIGGPPVTPQTAITITATDTISGVRLIEYAIDGGSWITYNNGFSLSMYSQGTHTINYRAIDNVGNVETTKTAAVQLGTDQLLVTTTALSAGAIGLSYSQTVVAVGGKTPYIWSVTSGSLPCGLTLKSATGVISGSPSSAGTYGFTVQVKDAGNSTSKKALSIIVYAPLGITTKALTSGSTGSVYSKTLAATGGSQPYVWSTTAGMLPSGLTLSSGGMLFGMPTSAGTFTATFKVTDATSSSTTKSLGLTIFNSLSISTSALASGTTGTLYSQTLTATGGKTPYTWSVTAGSLPCGLTLKTSSGVISGTPTTLGTYTFTVQVKDANNSASTKCLSIIIYAPPSITTSSLPAATRNTVYSRALAATGGLQPYAWSISAGTLPAGLTVNSSTGVIAGTPTTKGSSSFTVKVTDANTKTATKAYTITVN